MASIAAFVYFWSSAKEVSGGCATDTLYPSFLRMLATASQPEPSAKAPCTRTTFLIVIIVLLFSFQFFSHASALVSRLRSCDTRPVTTRLRYARGDQAASDEGAKRAPGYATRVFRHDKVRMASVHGCSYLIVQMPRSPRRYSLPSHGDPQI